jgi:hypothetical protein
MASSYHLTNSSIRQGGITECWKKNKVRDCSRHLWHNVHTKLHKIPSSHSPIIKYVQMAISSEGVRLDWIQLGTVGDAQRILRNGVIIPPREFKHPSRWFYRVLKKMKYDILLVTYGITSTHHFINFPPATFQLLNESKWISVAKASDSTGFG